MLVQHRLRIPLQKSVGGRSVEGLNPFGNRRRPETPIVVLVIISNVGASNIL
jgi:hypothetical protein